MPIRHNDIAIAEGRVDQKLLKAFVTVAEHGTVSKAAEILHITQPALSRQIRGLEQQAGFSLFARAGRRLGLTPLGEQFLGECRGFLAHAGAFSERARELRRGELQVLRIVGAALTIEAIFPGFLRRNAGRAGGIRTVLVEAEAADHLDMLERGEADLAVGVINMLPLDDRRFAHHVLPRFRMLAACSPSLDLAPGDTMEIAALSDNPLLLLDRSYATRNVFDAACHLADFKPNICFESRSVNALLAMAEAGHGIAIIPSILRTDPARLRTATVTHRHEQLQFTVAVIWDKRRTAPRHAERFSALLDEYIGEAYPALAGSPLPVRRSSKRREKARSTRPR
jgi:DNA-binding transcriptional LysR family regulator